MTRIGLTGIATAPDAIAALQNRFEEALGAYRKPVLALIDSPRWPSDCDCRLANGRPRRSGYDGGRRIDSRLRKLMANLAAEGEDAPRLSLFPTPRLEYFRRCIEDPSCKPHLRAIGRELFGCAALSVKDGPRGGAIFTRFMLSGFATYKALEALHLTAFEAYPDLQFRLWRDNRPLTSKNRRAEALKDRIEIVSAVADLAGIIGTDRIHTLDQADAAILAISMHAALDHGAAALIEEPEEGRFAVALPRHEVTATSLLTLGLLTSILTGA